MSAELILKRRRRGTLVTGTASRSYSTEFDNPIARLKAGLDHRPEFLKGLDQSRSPAVSKAHPNYPYSRFGTVGEVEKIFVFGDDDALLLFSIAADLHVRCSCQIGIHYVLAIQAPRTQMLGKRGR